MIAATSRRDPLRHAIGLAGRVGDRVLGPKDALLKPFGARSALGYLGLLIVGTAIAFFRIPHGSLQLLWGEDASVFATDAYAHSWWEIVLKPYAGYALAYPRTLAAIAISVVNLSQLPVAIALLACATGSAAGVIAVWALRGHIPALPVRLAIWVVIVAMPIAGVEVNGSIANSHWYLVLAAFFVLLTRQTSWRGIAVSTLVVIAAVLSDPLTILAAPLALLRLTDERRRRWIVPTSFFVATGLQLAVVTSTRLATTPSHPGIVEAARTVLYRTMLQPLLGSVGAEMADRVLGSRSIVIGAFCVLALLTLSLRTPAAGLALTAAGGSVVIFIVAGIVRWTPTLDPATHVYWSGSRYSVVPIALMSVAMAATLSHSLSSFRPPSSGVLVGVAVLIGIANLTSIGLAWNVTARAPTVVWQTAVEHAEALCATEPSRTVKIAGDPPNFILSMSCDSLRRANLRP